MNKKTTLEQAMSIVCQDREAQYGSPEDNFEVISALWSDYLGWRHRAARCRDVDGAAQDCPHQVRALQR